MYNRKLLNIFKIAGQQWLDDKAPQLGAALAFYSMLSLGPILLISIATAGLLLGEDAANGQIFMQLQSLFGAEGARVVQTLLANARTPSSGIIATVVGVVTLLIGGYGMFAQLQDSLNTIWKVPPSANVGVLHFMYARLVPVVMIIGAGILLLVSCCLSAILAALSAYFVGLLPQIAPLLEVANTVVTFGIATLLFGFIFKVFPNTYIRWRDVWPGAAVTAVLFSLGKLLIGIYLGLNAVTSTYGAAGSLVALLLWIYYSAQILFFGAELTQVYGRVRGED